MGKKLNQCLIYNNEAIPFFDENFVQILDSHLEWLKTAGSPTIKDIDIKYIGQYVGDFYTMLTDAGISGKYHRIILLLNGLTSPLQYTGQFMSYLCPDFGKVDNILGSYNTGKKKLMLEREGE